MSSLGRAHYFLCYAFQAAAQRLYEMMNLVEQCTQHVLQTPARHVITVKLLILDFKFAALSSASVSINIWYCSGLFAPAESRCSNSCNGIWTIEDSSILRPSLYIADTERSKPPLHIQIALKPVSNNDIRIRLDVHF
jgi:hypothetical protein